MDAGTFYGDEENDNERSEEEQESENDDGEDVPRQPRWKTSHDSSFPAYPDWQDSLPNADDILSPYQYFKTFFSDDILDFVVEQSNLYAAQVNLNKPLKLTTTELEKFLGATLYMSLFGLPATRMFWRPESRISQVADTLTLNRWEEIKRFLHFNDNDDQPVRSDDKRSDP
ncbi:PiggyBac transposable element-derived protein 2 [Labeo rohita]|uniref:PiggyBac transposable element-derived protein 2 n=1 Tax=Labeo rohita TaxID=84645 RepID=A0ABQ8L4Z0_LABRO|nr:PiggyBac transposable element-derived protein 2 [Labeo rohita]